MYGMVRSRSLTPATTEDALKAFLLMLGNTKYGVVSEVQALKRGIPCDEKLDGGDHARMCDEVEEAGNVLLVEDEVIGGVKTLK